MAPPTDDLLDRHELDTWLARELLRSGRLSVELLRQGLHAARAGRESGGSSLARRLVGARLCEERELRELLHEAAGGPLGRRSQSRAWEAGLRVGDYQLLERLGAGGMGEVWRATHLPTGAERALKVLPLGGDPEAALRFRREGQSQARVDAHPNVLAVHEVGVQSGRAFLAMDVAPDGSLRERIEQGPLPPREAARLVAALARGLSHVHAHGVLHRDLKPDNVLFRGDSPLLADFGLAKLLDERSLTATGVILGTPSYMAPEQIDPSLGAIDERSDVYGLGAILYVVLTGRPPHSGANVMSVLVQVTQGKVSPPSSIEPVPAPWEAICLRALSRDMQARPPSAEALARELEGYLRGEAPLAASRAPALLLAALVGGGLVLAALLSRVSSPAPTQPVQPTLAANRVEPRPSASGAARATPAERSESSAASLSDVELETWSAIGRRRSDRLGAAERSFLVRCVALGHAPARTRVAYLACVSKELRDPVWGHAELLRAALRDDPSALEHLVKLHTRPAAGFVGFTQDRFLAGAAGRLFLERHSHRSETDYVRSLLRERLAGTPRPGSVSEALRALQAASRKADAALAGDSLEVDPGEGTRPAARIAWLRRVALRGSAAAWRQLGLVLLAAPQPDLPEGLRCLTLGALGGDSESMFHLASALVGGCEFRHQATRSLFAQDQLSRVPARCERPRLARELFELAAGEERAEAPAWAALARRAAQALDREPLDPLTAAASQEATLEERLRELERLLWLELERELRTLSPRDRELLRDARAASTLIPRVAMQLRLSWLGFRPALYSAVMPALAHGDHEFALARLLALALDGELNALERLISLQFPGEEVGSVGLRREPALAAAALQIHVLAQRSQVQGVGDKQRRFSEDSRGAFRRLGVSAPPRPREVLRQRLTRARQIVAESERELREQVRVARDDELEAALRTQALRGDRDAHFALARAYGQGIKGVQENSADARTHLLYAVMARSDEAALELGCAALLEADLSPGAREAVKAARKGLVTWGPDRELGVACIRAARSGPAGQEARVLEGLLPRIALPLRADDWDLVHEQVVSALAR